MLGCPNRLHVSIAPKAASLTSLYPAHNADSARSKPPQKTRLTLYPPYCVDVPVHRADSTVYRRRMGIHFAQDRVRRAEAYEGMIYPQVWSGSCASICRVMSRLEGPPDIVGNEEGAIG